LVDLSIAAGRENETCDRADCVTFSDNLETTMRLAAKPTSRWRDRCGDSEDDYDDDVDEDDDFDDDDEDDEDDDEDDEDEPETWQVRRAADDPGFPLKAGTA
jgi:hypothetical protein